MILAGGSPLMTDPNLHHILWQPPEEVYERLAAHLPRTGTENVAVRLLPWTRLLDSMYDPLSRSFGVVLEAGPGAGKTTLLDNFVERFPQFDCVKISFNDPYTTAAELFRCHGVDAEQKRADIPTDVIRVMLVDDVAFKFHEKAFWNDLILMYIPPNLRFVFAGTYSVICREPQLLKKASWWHQLWRRDFSLSDDEARAVLQLPSGLPASLQTPMLMQVMIRDCKGHLNTLRMACDLMRAKFGSSRPRWCYTISRGR